MPSPVEELRAAVEAVTAELGNGAVTPTLERPRKAGFGDYSTNAAMLLAPALKAPPREIAERLGAALQERLGERVEKVEVAGPGFLNVFLADAWYVAAAAHVLEAGDDWGGGTAAERERVLIEFVSANPTGPLTAASGRHGAYGDALARLLEFAGHEVAREYYFNDAGAQLLQARQSIRARARGEALPEDGYQGHYVGELAAQIEGAAERDPEDLAFAGGAADDRADQGDDGALPGRTSTSGSPSAACTTARSIARWSGSRPRASRTGPTARCGCGRPTSATARTR